MNIEGIEISPEFQDIINKIESGQHVFLTGNAGTGKSTLIEYFKKNTKRNVAIVAPTGIAALNVGGMTIHSFFGFPALRLNSTHVRRQHNKYEIFVKLHTLIIDEISMVRVDMMDAIDEALRVNRGSPTPFGGVQILAVGDLFQLPPVANKDDQKFFEENYPGYYFFDAKVWKRCELQKVELTKIHRQTDPDFIEVLNAVRKANITDEQLAKLNHRYFDMTVLEKEPTITLCSTNSIAARINEQKLWSIKEPSFFYLAEVIGKFEENLYPTDFRLELRKGAQIMMLRNDFERRWVNGTLGIIWELFDDKIVVEIGDSTYEIEKVRWERIEYHKTATGRIEDKIIGTFEQFPVKLAYACTIHKSQGQTYDSAYIDMGNGAFTHGQTYVALSRCRSLKGIKLSTLIYPTDLKVDKRVVDYMYGTTE